jgi:hypothetical protein
MAPRRDEEVDPDQIPYGDTVAPRLAPPEAEQAPPGSATAGPVTSPDPHVSLTSQDTGVWRIATG